VAPGCFATAPSCGCAGEGATSNTSVSATAVQHTTVNQLINTIESSTIKVSFAYTEDTSLSTWQKQLNTITVLDKITNKTKSFSFSYGKFSGDPRLRLDQIQEIGFDGTTKPPYKFYYETGNLPAKGAMSKDFHGYYNGKNNTSLVPYSLAAYYSIAPSYRSRLADRREDLAFLKTGTLQKIEYPTGGSTEFDYEANAVPATTNGNPRYTTKYASLHASSTYTTSGSYRVFSTEFELTKDLETSGTPVGYVGSSNICGFDPLEPSIDCSQFNIYPKLSDGRLGAALFSPYKVIGAEGSVVLPKGTYMLELKVETSKLIANPTALISVNLSWEEQEPINTATRYTGGLRVQSVIDKDADGSLAKQTDYSYKGLVGYSLNINNTVKGYGESSVFSSDNIGVHPAVIKSGYFYTEVTIDKIGDHDQTLRTVEKYTDAYRNKSHEPQLQQQLMYAGDQKVREVFYTYDNTAIKTLEFYTLSDKVLCFTPENTHNTALGYTNPDFNRYYHRKNVLIKKTDVDYFGAANEPLSVSINQYKYAYNNDMQVIKEELDGRLYAENEQAITNQTFEVQTNGKYTEIAYTYPADHQTENTTIAMSCICNLKSLMEKQ